jgi:hypothetical protein
MEIVEQLRSEVSERAGSPEGLLRLIHLIIEEMEKIDVTSPEAPNQYAALLRAYVLVKRQLTFFNRRAEFTAIDQTVYNQTVGRLKHAIREKRDEAREHAARLISPEKLKEIKRYVGTHLNIRPSEFMARLDDVKLPSGHSYNRMTS